MECSADSNGWESNPCATKFTIGPDLRITDEWVNLQDALSGFVISRLFLQRASDFLAIPVTLSIVLMIADSLLIWAALSQHRILIWPWLVLYAIEYVVLVALLVYFMVVMPKTYLKVGGYGVLMSLTFVTQKIPNTLCHFIFSRQT